MKALILTMVLLLGLVGCGDDKDSKTYYSEVIEDEQNPYEDAVKEGIFVPDANITDIITAVNVQLGDVNVSDSGMQLVCLPDATCMVTIDNSVHTDSGNTDDHTNNTDNAITY